MIGRRQLPPEYEKWNERWGAPYGRDSAKGVSMKERIGDAEPQRFGPFAYQMNTDTRIFEYPWAYFSCEAKPGMRILEVGGGLSGMQYVLAMEGCEVVNVDPSAKQSQQGWQRVPVSNWWLTPANHRRLNEIFGTDVRLVAEPVQSSGLEPGFFDRALCLSVIEHVDQAEAVDMLNGIAGLLAPGGLCVMTVDLFLDVKPFGVLDKNFWGTNIDVWKLVSGTDLELAYGDPRELFGFPEFDYDRTVSLIPEFLLGIYPALSQSLILRKRS